MFKTIFSFAKIAVLSTAIVLMTSGVSEAQRRGGGGRGGGFHGGGGGYHGGGYHGGGYGRGFGYGGYGRGFGYGGYGYGGWGGFGGYYPYYGGYWGGYGGGYYPYYDSGYYAPSTYYYAPSYYTTPYSYFGNTAPVTTYTPQVYQPNNPSDTANPASATSSTTATVQVVLPSPTAEVWFGDHKTSQLGTTRHFVSPPLTLGQTYTYEIRATWMVNGQPVTQTRSVRVEAGKTATVDFSQPG